VDVERFVLSPRATKADTPPPNGLMFGGAIQKIHRPEPPVLMLRIFDFTVESGRTYRYRSRLVFFNTRRLDPPGSRKLEFSGPWSEPTNTVNVP